MRLLCQRDLHLHLVILTYEEEGLGAEMQNNLHSALGSTQADSILGAFLIEPTEVFGSEFWLLLICGYAWH